MTHLFEEYRDLKEREDERDDEIKRIRIEMKERIEDIEAQYPDLDDQIRKVRLRIQGEAAAMPGQIWETDHGIAEIQNRVSWEIGHPAELVEWLNAQNKADLWDYTFKKGDINKICSGLSTANMELPSGTDKVITPTLSITLEKR